MPDIVLTTINARYIHASFGLRYLRANLGELHGRSRIVELTDAETPAQMAERLLRQQPRIIGVGVYIWNARQSRDLVAILKRVAPEVVVVVGGPEVSHECDEQEICALADYVITGEGDLAFATLCHELLAGACPQARQRRGGEPPFAMLALPYGLYDEEDVAQRVLYVEASRGCPYRCEFCLSALDTQVRLVDIDAFLAEMQGLLDRGARQFKFVDRTFNLKIEVARRILQFFHERQRPGLFVHFEMVPDRLPEALRQLLAGFAPGAVQLEIGIQTFNPAVAERISRQQDLGRTRDNLRWLRQHTGVHVHADLIAGLPGEDLDSFARGFDELVGLGPQEIQVGILKRLRGTPITRHTAAHAMVYADRPPYEVLSTGAMDFTTVMRVKRFAQAWDAVANSGNFRDTAPLLWGQGSPFWGFLAFADWLAGCAGRTHGLALDRLVELVHEYLLARGHPAAAVRATLLTDYQRAGRSKVPRVLSNDAASPPRRRARARDVPARQARHL